jgi:hypothetical protein
MVHDSLMKRAQSVHPSFTTALSEVIAQLSSEQTKIIFLFWNDAYSISEVETALQQFRPKEIWVGCRTSGEIGLIPESRPSIVGVAFLGASFDATVIHIESLSEIQKQDLNKVDLGIKDAQLKQKQMGESAKTLGVLLVDGLSGKEEILVGNLAAHLNHLPLVGGSSGDGLQFKDAPLLLGNRLTRDSAILVLLTTNIPFVTLKTQHFKSSDRRFVITRCEAEARRVYEIDGEIASEWLASMLGKKSSQMTPADFIDHPITLKVGNEDYVRSIQKVYPDGSLGFYCSVETGLVLRVANKESMLEVNERVIRDTEAQFQEIKGSLLFECVLRRLEIDQLSPRDRTTLFSQYQKLNALGFYTYGEQFGSLHINQTLTGVIFGKK